MTAKHTSKPRRDWTGAMMFPLMFGALIMFVPVLQWMGVNQRYNPKTGTLVEPHHLPLWPFYTAGITLIAISLLFAYLAWRGRSPLTPRERDFIEVSLRRHLENLDYLDDIYRNGITSLDDLTKTGHTVDVNTDIEDELQRNDQARKIARSTLDKVDRLL